MCSWHCLWNFDLEDLVARARCSEVSRLVVKAKKERSFW